MSLGISMPEQCYAGIARLKTLAGEMDDGLGMLRYAANESEALAMWRNAIDASFEIVENLVQLDPEWKKLPTDVQNSCGKLILTAWLSRPRLLSRACDAPSRSIDADHIGHLRHSIGDSRAYPSTKFRPPRGFRR
ncbi:MAG TPA: hypothetical protein VLC46_21550 [Thermoanaerobaculia bacterium]|nr:hypothetical protein [Thermoanaerobaculia bacterium]